MKLLLLVALMLVPMIGQAYAEMDECNFTVYIEKSWVFFGDRPWVTGFVENCEADIYKTDFVYMRILTLDGNVVEDNWIPNKTTAKSGTPQKYVFNDSVYRGGGLGGNADTTEVEIVFIRENQFFMYLPQITQIDFDHRGVYELEFTYGEEVRSVHFATLSNDLHYLQTIEDLCYDSENRMDYLEHSITQMELSLKRFITKGVAEDHFQMIQEQKEELRLMEKFC